MLSWDFPPHATGGTAAHVHGLATSLGRAGHEVVVLTIAERIAGRVPVVPEFRVLRTAVDLPWLPPVETVARTASANHAFTKLGSSLRDQDPALDGWAPDIVHGHDWRTGWAADALATIHRVPFVLTMHGTERMRHGGQLPLGDPTDINSIEWWLAFQADRLIAPTRFMVEQLITGFELDADCVARIPNGVDPVWWAPPAGGNDVLATREPLVVSWGNVQFEKGFQVLARSINIARGRVPDIRGVIAGRGSYLPELQSQVDVEGVSDIVDLPGYVHDDALRALAHRAGVVVIPSLYEPFGIVALEALAAGAPLIAARTGGLAELIGDTGAGQMFEPGNPEDLARCITTVLTDPELAAQMIENGRALVEHTYAWDAIAASTAAVYDGLLTSTIG